MGLWIDFTVIRRKVETKVDITAAFTVGRYDGATLSGFSERAADSFRATVAGAAGRPVRGCGWVVR